MAKSDPKPKSADYELASPTPTWRGPCRDSFCFASWVDAEALRLVCLHTFTPEHP